MNDVIQIQMNRDKLAVSNNVVRSIEDILSQGKNINYSNIILNYRD